MEKLLRPFSILSIGIIAGIIIFAKFGKQASNIDFNDDSLFVKDTFASPQTLDQANQEVDNSRQTSITRAVHRISPAVVSVNVLQVKEYVRQSPFSSRDPLLREFFPELFKDRRLQQEIQSIGSGFIISDDGYILTNDHVVSDAKKIVVTMSEGKKADARIIGTDPTSDVALLKIDIENLPYVTFGNSDEVIIGEWAIAIGNPFGLFEINNRPTVTVGVISALDRDFGEMEGRIYQDMIQTDASINHGNSGGPLCNALGQSIGMNTFIYSGSRYSEGSVGIGFAIPINRIKRLLEDLKKYHKVDRDFWIGIKVQNLNDIISNKMGYKGTRGVLVTHIDRESPADEAGLRLGDIIIEMDNKDINSDKDVFEVVYGTDLKVGDDLKLKVWRDDKELELTFKLASIRNN